MRFYQSLIQLLFSSLLFLTGCIGNFGEMDFGSTAPPQNEPVYAGKPTTFPSEVPTRILTGKAEFKARVPSQSTGLSAGAVILPIPFAEFHIYAGTQRIQQGETKRDGTFSFEIPDINGSYQVRVFSRAANSYLNVSVLDQINTNTPYYISQNFTLNEGVSTPSTLALVAHAHSTDDPEIRGGAFNIYYNVFHANEFIRKELQRNNGNGVAPTVITNANWIVAPKLKIYWKAGFNPYTYFTNEPGASSFYIPSTDSNSRMAFILGGSRGNTSSVDTDHFDDSVILHEYMHFLEDTYSNSSSMGGYHDGDAIIDPRLAWSEGLANYFQGAVQTGNDGFDLNTDGFYLDTAAGRTFSFDLIAHGYDCTVPDYAYSDKYAHSGIFRELSISRTLYKLTRANSVSMITPQKVYGANGQCDTPTGVTHDATHGGGVPFFEIWKSLTGVGLPNSGEFPTNLKNSVVAPISNAGIFTNILASNMTLSPQALEILESENQPLTNLHYMPFLAEAGNTSCPQFFDGAAPENASFPTSNQLTNNHFYLVKKSSLGDSRIGFDILPNPSGPNLNLDLMIYRKNYRYIEDSKWSEKNSTLLGASRSTSSSEYLDTRSYNEEYLVVNVKVKALNLGNLPHQTTYQLRLGNGVNLCPRAL